MNPASVISLRNITKQFRLAETASLPGGVFTALDKVSFDVQQGECIVIGGANGSGKSLLMNIIAGLTKPTSGEITVTDDVGLVFQDADSQILGETPREDIAVGPLNQKLSRQEVCKRVATALQSVDLDTKADFPARTLSGGEKRRLAAAGILAMHTSIFLFDEPYANLDYDGVRQVNTLVASLKLQQKTIVILTHELEKCLGFATRFIVLHHGRIVFDGTPENGLAENLETWSIRHPLRTYANLGDLIWI